MNNLQNILQTYRDTFLDQRDKGDSFEKLIQFYLKNDPKYDFKEVLLWRDWAKKNNRNQNDLGIDLVAEENETGNFWAIQCKFYAEDAKIYKKHIDSFFTESGKKPFTQRLIALSTTEASKHVISAIEDQQIPCATLTLNDLSESAIDWTKYSEGKKAVYKPKKTLRPHQVKALEATLKGFETADRGKLLMACGTGKTYTALKIAEKVAGKGSHVLFLVPSLSLLSQSLNEWTIDTQTPIHSFAVCSDVTVGKKKKSDDIVDISISDLAYPATTNAKKLAEKLSKHDPEKMTVVFSTYHSLQVVSEAQSKFDIPEFDLIICDEAHRTTGASLTSEDESNFVKVHDQKFVKGKKRLYMTATPRIFGEVVKTKAKEVDAILCSMDDENLFGQTFYTINFSEAVHLGLLSDYKVLVLAVDEEHVSKSIQKLFTEMGSELKLDDASKIIGCWKALSKHGLDGDFSKKNNPMRRAVAFCRDIKSSELFTEYFTKVVDEYLKEDSNFVKNPLKCELKHVQGSFSSLVKTDSIEWLKRSGEYDSNLCRILTNARCLTEGVDVPSLDATIFLHPRKSQIDIVQAVGRVMRKTEGKNLGYVILPIGIPPGVSPDQALNDNERYRVVWQILQALRSHDDKFDAFINKIDLGVDITSKMEVIAVTDQLPQAKEQKEKEIQIGSGGGHIEEEASTEATPKSPKQLPLRFEIGDIEKAIYAKIVKKCGNRQHWEDWASDIANIAQTHITRIKASVSKEDSLERRAFKAFLDEIRDDLNPSISEDDAIEMLAQHIITKPVFDALFEKYDFAANNPVSIAMQEILKVLDEHNLKNESESLAKFYASVQFRAQGINNSEAKQKIVVELYDKFFRNAFPRLTEKLGIVYTPVEVVDFIIHSVNDVLQEEFGQTLGSKGVHILDPFTGTGTFITRLLQSGLIKKEELPYKYQNEIHANEIILLAYYIAAINIEAVYHSLVGGEYKPFQGICLTDTFQLYEKDDMISKLLVDNSSRRVRQKELDIRVILGNPPYSAGQTSANDNNANVSYPSLDENIKQTYARYSKMTSVKNLYDSYIRAMRWGSDRIGDNGVMAYVSNAGWIDGNAMDGLRKSVVDDFSSIYIFHLRGNQRTSGELSRKEGGKIFGGGSRTPIAISLFIKNPQSKEKGKIYFHDIGDYLSREDKLKIIEDLKSVNGIKQGKRFLQLIPDKHNDWLNQRDDSFDDFISLGDKKNKNSECVFENYSLGLATGRDNWCYNFSYDHLKNNIESHINFYNKELKRYQIVDTQKEVNSFIDRDLSKVSWNRNLINDFKKGISHSFDENSIRISMYRPYIKSWCYFNKQLNAMLYKLNSIFPTDKTNFVITISGKGSKNGLSVLISNKLLDLNFQEAGAQCFPLWIYEDKPVSEDRQSNLFNNTNSRSDSKVKDGITDSALKHFHEAYPKESITKEDIFYYIYGLLHSEEYRNRYADNLSKQLPRIPRVKKTKDFWDFSKAGRILANLHISYESVEPYPVTFHGLNPDKQKLTQEQLRVTKMKFGKDKDKSTIIYNSNITIKNIPLETYDYVVNGKPAIEWVMERQSVKTDKASGIVNDANLYAIETVVDPAYPLRLIQRVITVSLETMKIVRGLPGLEI
jgi:predicted helicase